MAEQIYKVRDPQGNLREIKGPAGASDEDVIAQAQKLFGQAPKDYKAMSAPVPVDPTADMSQGERFLAGTGKSLEDIKRGLAQLFGGGPDAEEMRRIKEQDAPLMNTGAGIAGNVVGNVAALAPLAVVPGANTVGGAAALGSIYGALQPTEDPVGRLKNMAEGALLGGGSQWGGSKGAQAAGLYQMDQETARLAKQSQNTVRDATLQQGQKAGYVVPPSAVNPSFLNKRLESIGGKAAVGQEAAMRNQSITDQLARKAATLAPDQPLSEQALSAARKAAAKPYQEIAALSPKAAQELETWKAANLESKLQWGFFNRQGDPAAFKAAKAADQTAANALNAVEQEAINMRRSALVSELKKARVQIAKIHDVEKAINTGTGSVDASVLGRALDRGAPLTDELKTIASFQQAFPAYMREASRIPTPGVSKSEALSSVLFGIGGNMAAGPIGTAAAALPLLSGPTRSAVLSKPFQAGLRPDYSPALLEKAGKMLSNKDRTAALARMLIGPSALTLENN